MLLLKKNQEQRMRNVIKHRETKHGDFGAFNYEGDNDDVKTITANKKVGDRATNSVSGKTLAEDVFSVAGDTTLPSYQEEGDEVDSFVSSTCSEVAEKQRKLNQQAHHQLR